MNNISQAKFDSCGKPHKYKKLLFAMCWFHAVLVDRRKFLNLGWKCVRPSRPLGLWLSASVPLLASRLLCSPTARSIAARLRSIPYDFNDSDFEVSELCLRLYLDEYEETPWDALKYLISEINYGGRVTDDLDRRLMNVYICLLYTSPSPRDS